MTSSISNLFDHGLIKSSNIFHTKLKIEIVSLQTENRIVLLPIVVINRNIMLSNICLVTITKCRGRGTDIHHQLRLFTNDKFCPR